MQRRGFLAATAGVLVYGSRIVESAAFADVRTSHDQGARNAKDNGQIEADRHARVNGETDADRNTLAARWYDRERHFADTSFGRIAYIDRGNGPVALFVHGFRQDLCIFRFRSVTTAAAAAIKSMAAPIKKVMSTALV
jgi:hypothetical protein